MARRSWVLWLAGCGGTGEELLPSPAELVDGSVVVGFEALPGAGTSPYRAQVRSYNAWGVSVAAESVSAEIDGEPATVFLDGLGYGGVSFDSPGVHTLAVDGGDPAESHVFELGWAPFGGSPALPAALPVVVEVLGVTNGVIGRAGPELWFSGDTTPPHRILQADSDLLGVRAAQVDVDGQTDLIAWTSNQVFVLRGHTGGGFGWGVSYRASGLTVASADVGDMSGDNLPDIVIAWVGPDGRGVLDVWEAIGVFRFMGAEPRTIPGKPVSVSVSDANGDGIAQATVLHDDSTWSRYLRGEERQYIPVGPSLPPILLIEDGSRFERCGDVNADASADVVAGTAPSVDASATFYVIDIDIDALECDAGVAGAQCVTEYVKIDGLTGGDVACADANADFTEEMWGWDRLAGLRVYQFDLATRLFDARSVDYPFGPGAFDVADRDGDRIGDVIVADDRVWSWYFGAPSTEVDGIWSVRRELTSHVRDEIVSPFAQVETDGDDGTLEWATTTSTSTSTTFRLVQYVPLSGGAPILGSVRLDDEGDLPTDMAACGDDVFVAIGGQVVRVSVADPAAPEIVARTGSSVTRVACGDGPGTATVVTVDAAGVAELRTNALTVVDTDPGTWGDATFADLGAGATLVGCETPGCSVAAWDSGAGVYTVSGDATALTLTADGAEAVVVAGAAGEPFVTDLDGDGREDLVAWDRSRRLLAVVRSSGEGIAPPELVHLVGDYNHLAFADGDGDGAVDLFGTNEIERLVHTILTLPPVPPATTP